MTLSKPLRINEPPVSSQSLPHSIPPIKVLRVRVPLIVTVPATFKKLTPLISSNPPELIVKVPASAAAPIIGSFTDDIIITESELVGTLEAITAPRSDVVQFPIVCQSPSIEPFHVQFWL